MEPWFEYEFEKRLPSYWTHDAIVRLLEMAFENGYESGYKKGFVDGCKNENET